MAPWNPQGLRSATSTPRTIYPTNKLRRSPTEDPTAEEDTAVEAEDTAEEEEAMAEEAGATAGEAVDATVAAETADATDTRI